MHCLVCPLFHAFMPSTNIKTMFLLVFIYKTDTIFCNSHSVIRRVYDQTTAYKMFPYNTRVRVVQLHTLQPHILQVCTTPRTLFTPIIFGRVVTYSSCVCRYNSCTQADPGRNGWVDHPPPSPIRIASSIAEFLPYIRNERDISIYKSKSLAVSQ